VNYKLQLDNCKLQIALWLPAVYFVVENAFMC
jgi:hypothetical protein